MSEDIDLTEEMSVGSCGFRIMLQGLINKGCMENGSDTPDYILAHYLTDCLEAYDRAVNARRDWHSTENTKDWISKI